MIRTTAFPVGGLLGVGPSSLPLLGLLLFGFFGAGCQSGDSRSHLDAGMAAADGGGASAADSGGSAVDSGGSGSAADGGLVMLPCADRMCDPATELCVVGSRFGPGTVERQGLCVSNEGCTGCRCAVDAAPVAWFNAYDEQLMCNFLNCNQDGDEVTLDCNREPAR